MILALPLLAVVAVTDPRPPIVGLALAGQLRPALAATERALAGEPERARQLGLDYLRADLLQRSGREREAVEGFARAMATAPLAPWARYRLALAQERLGHPEVAAGLAATLVAAGPPGALARPGLALLRRGFAGGGDCRLLGGVHRERLPSSERRLFDLIQAECLWRAGRTEPARAAAIALLEQESDDALARDVAELLLRLPGEPRDERSARLLGLTAYAHREFEIAVPWLERALAGRAAADLRAWDLGFALARSEFWLGRHRQAAARFRALAGASALAGRRAAALYQAGRALELAGESGAAAAAFAEAAAAEPLGEWAPAALLSALRQRALGGDERGARALLARLGGRREWRSALARGALFLAAGDLVRGRTEHAAESLAAAERSRAAAAEEIAYWRGRLAELAGTPAAAVDHYLEALERDPFHPFARAAARRLARPELAATARARARTEVAAERPDALRRAALLLAADGPETARLRGLGIATLARQGALAGWLSWQPVPLESWPLWTAPAERPEDLLVGLGRFDEAPGAMLRHFPLARLALAFTGARLLADSGAAARALAVAEALFARRPRAVPIDWVDPALRRLLLPLPWSAEIRAESAARRIDPFLLAGLIREESRFDPHAVSPAAARGLTQFVLPTARRIARLAGLPPPRVEDLERPPVAIALGASYLAELATRFQGREEVMAAAYNAGEEQAVLWQRYCFTQETEEFLSKIGFRETRAYVQRVLGSRDHYADLYGGPGS